MLKYYSTLNENMYDSEEEAQKAEDRYVQEYFEEMDKRLARKQRVKRQLLDTHTPTSILEP